MSRGGDSAGSAGGGGAGNRCQVRQRAFTWLRRQKRRGSRQEKRYLPHRITQEKHQLSRVMATPGWAPRRARGSGNEHRPLRSRRWIGVGRGARREPRPPGASAPREQPECPAPSRGSRGPDVAPSPRKPLREARAAAGAPLLGDFLRRLPVSAPRQRDSLCPPACWARWGAGDSTPATWEARGAARERRVATGQRRCQAPGVHL